MMRSDYGVILRLTKLADTSLIVTWCMRSEGLVKTVAKGARNPKSSFSGKLDLFFEAEVEWRESRKSELHHLGELKVKEYREEVRKSYRKTMLASYFISLVEFVMEAGQAAEDLYDLLQRGLNFLSRAEGDEKVLRFFEKEVARCLGILEQGVSPETCLLRVYGSLPRSRKGCVDLLVPKKGEVDLD